tara:strand:- start:45441 stop:45923 length:483 start_codon:yes stop_codon:yes gene_type:complete
MSFARGGWFVWLSLLVACMLTVVELPQWAVWLRPSWALLVLLYWVLALNRAGIMLAWVLGIVLDLLSGSLLGVHALALVIVVYIVLKLQKQLRVFPLVQQAFIVFILSVIYQLIIYWAQSVVGNAPTEWLFWLAPFINGLIWPWMFALLRHCRRYFKVGV